MNRTGRGADGNFLYMNLGRAEGVEKGYGYPWPVPEHSVLMSVCPPARGSGGSACLA